jgi:hypothetical protein
MTVMMAVPAMMVVMVVVVSNSNDNLGARCRYQRSKEHQSEKSKTNLLHTYSDAQPLL